MTSVSSSRIVVSVDGQSRILACDNNMEDFLGFSGAALDGRSFRILCGPNTNIALLTSAVKQTTFLNTQSFPIELYDCLGRSRNLIATCAPFHNVYAELIGCVISMETPTAPEESDSDSCSSVSTVLDESYDSCGSVPSVHDDAATHSCAAAEDRRRPATNPCEEEESKPIPSFNCKPRDRSKSAVHVTLDLLHSLEDCPLNKAADRLGISASALKRACRALGVSRWQCKTRAQVTPLNHGVAYARKLFRKYSKGKSAPTTASQQPQLQQQPQQQNSASLYVAAPGASQSNDFNGFSVFTPTAFWRTSSAAGGASWAAAAAVAEEGISLEIGDGWSESAVADGVNFLDSLEVNWPEDL